MIHKRILDIQGVHSININGIEIVVYGKDLEPHDYVTMCITLQLVGYSHLGFVIDTPNQDDRFYFKKETDE